MNLQDKQKISRQQVHLWLYFFCLCLLAIAIPTSRTLISASQILMGVNWLAEGNFKSKLKTFFNNKPALAFSLIFILYLIGLMWTEDLYYGINDNVLTKLPLFTLTLLIATSQPLDIKKIRTVLFLFIATVLTVSLIGIYIYLTADTRTFRIITPYASHLYFSIMLIISAFTLPWLIKQITEKKVWLILSLVISTWMLIFIFLSRSLSGLASIAGVAALLIIWVLINYKSVIVRTLTIFVFVSLIALTTGFLIYMHNLVTKKVETNLTSLDLYTEDGNAYTHDTTRTLRENGYLVYIYISESELEKKWNKRSDIDYDGEDKISHSLKHTLFRYMSSKGYRKDGKHLKLLSEEDIQAIEEGTTNYLYKNWPGVFIRIHQNMMGLQKYRETNNPNWSSYTLRVDLWKASIEAIQKKPFFGWGTGDIYHAIDYGLVKINSQTKLEDSKPHNQYLLLLLTLGITGFILFFACYVYTVYKTKAYRVMPFNVFVVAYGVNMLANNPIDAQYGLTMFVFFTLFFGIIYKDKK